MEVNRAMTLRIKSRKGISLFKLILIVVMLYGYHLQALGWLSEQGFIKRHLLITYMYGLKTRLLD